MFIVYLKQVKILFWLESYKKMDVNSYIEILLNGGILDERQCRILCEKVITYIKIRLKRFC